MEMHDCFRFQLSRSHLTGAKLRFGGCFSKDVEERLSCSTKASRDRKYINAKDIVEIASVLDSLTVKYLMDIVRDPNRITSYGGLMAQIYDGFQNFLESAGFNRSKVREVLNRVLYHDLTDDEFIKLISNLGTTNEETKGLSSAMLDLTKRHFGYDTLPEKVTSITSAATALVFPVLINAKYDAEEMFSKMTNAFESPDAELSEDACLFLFHPLFVTEIVIASNINQVSDRIYELLFVPIHHITERCFSLYPDDPYIHHNHFLQMRLRAVLKDHANCPDGVQKCRKKLQNGLNANSIKYLELMQTTSGLSPSPLVLASQRWIYATRHIFEQARSNPVALLGSVFTTYVTKAQKETLAYFHALSDSLEQSIERYGLHT